MRLGYAIQFNESETKQEEWGKPHEEFIRKVE